MTRRPPNANRSCIICGHSPISGYKFCSLLCRDRGKRQRTGQPTWAERYPTPSASIERRCAWCDQSFKRRLRGGDAARCCSRDCGFKLLRWERHQSSVVTREREIYAKWSARNRGVPTAGQPSRADQRRFTAAPPAQFRQRESARATRTSRRVHALSAVWCSRRRMVTSGVPSAPASARGESRSAKDRVACGPMRYAYCEAT